MDVVKITLWVPDQAALKNILSTANVEHDCGSPKRDSDGSFIIDLYASPAEAQKITALGYRHEVDPNYGEILQQRQQEVSKTDRFKGGTVTPVGLGIKR
jgi:hypothetical protein